MKTIKIGIIGAGRIAHVHSKSITYNIPGVEIVSIADPFMSKSAMEWIKEMGISKIEKDYRDILADVNVDAVLICSSSDTHASITREAAEAGKHIFCEKPIDLNPDEIIRTLKTVEKAGVKLQVGFNRRFDHNFKALKQASIDGKIGDVEMVRVISRDPTPPPVSYVKTSGGLFLDMMIHDFDMVRFLSGSEIEEVSATGAVLIDPAIGKAGDVDTAIVTMRLKNGALAVIDNSRRASYGYDQRAEIFGSEGSIFSGNDTLNTAVLSDESGVHEEKPLYFFLERYEKAFIEEIRSFINAVRDDKDVPVGGVDGLYPVLVALAAAESVKTGKTVKVKYPKNLI